MLPPSLTINPASLWRRGFLLFVFSLAVFACIVMQALIGFALLPILAISFVMYWRSGERVCVLRMQDSGEVEVHDHQGRVELMVLLPSSVVTDVLIVLHLKSQQKKLAVVLWPDSASSEVLRQWRVWLRWAWQNSKRGDDVG